MCTRARSALTCSSDNFGEKIRAQLAQSQRKAVSNLRTKKYTRVSKFLYSPINYAENRQLE